MDGKPRWRRFLVAAALAGATGAGVPVLAAAQPRVQPPRPARAAITTTSTTVPSTTTVPTSTTTTVPSTTTTEPSTTTTEPSTTTVPVTTTEPTTTTTPTYTVPNPCDCTEAGCAAQEPALATATIAADSPAAALISTPDEKPQAIDDASAVKGDCPVVLAEGDSITSGHNIDHYKDQNGRLICEDPTYSYAYLAWTKMRADKRWKTAPYVNAAFSGFGTSEVIDGGTDACKQKVAVKPLELVAKILHAHQQKDAKIGDGNVVMQSVGINDAPWTEKLGEIIAAQDKIKLEWPLRVVVGGMDAAKCEKLLQEKWDPLFKDTLPEIKKRAEQITRTLIGEKTGDPKVRIFWLDYYNFAGTGYINGSATLPWNGQKKEFAIGPILPSGCQAAFDKRRKQVDDALHAGVAAAKGEDNVKFIDTGLDGQGGLLQTFVGADGLKEAAESLVVAAFKKAEDKLKEAAFKTLLAAVETAEKGVAAAEAALDKAKGNLAKRAAEALLKKAQAELAKAEKDLNDWLAKTIQNEGKIDWEKIKLKPYWEFGWPHPNAQGQAQIAGKILAALGLG